MQKTLVFEDNNICIFKPTNFQESSVIGEPICCLAYSQGRWDEHYNGYQEAIYYVYDVMKEGTQHDFVSITVRPNGRALVLDKEHNWWSKQQSIQYIQSLEEGASYITTKDGKTIKTENKKYKTNTNMAKKQVIRLTESDLHRIIKESVNKILKEEQNDIYDYAHNYAELIKHEMHNLWELLEKVPYTYRAEIYNMGNSLQSILYDIRMKDKFNNWNN